MVTVFKFLNIQAKVRLKEIITKAIEHIKAMVASTLPGLSLSTKSSKDSNN